MVTGSSSAYQPTLFPPPYRYVMDACSIISQKPDEPHRRHVYSSMWKMIDKLVFEKTIVTCSEIEIEVEDEELKEWLAQCGCVILAIDDEVQRNVAKIVSEHPRLLNFKNAKSSGDAFLIATAMRYGLAVVTEEDKVSDKKIPHVCRNYNIPCFNITELAEKEGWSF